VKNLYTALPALALLIAGPLLANALSSPDPITADASKKCVVTEPVYVLDQQMLPAGVYCVPWI
jgi:hypothetical protein